jgi:hypothetical protein
MHDAGFSLIQALRPFDDTHDRPFDLAKGSLLRANGL